MSSPVRLVLVLPVALLIATTLHAAERSGKQAFENSWMGRTVVVKRTLFSVVYDERSRRLPIVKHRDRVSGLTVVTPQGTVYYQFDARRDSQDDIVAQDPNSIVSEIRTQYVRSMHLDNGAVEDIEPLMLVRYSPGVEFIVRKVQIDRDRIRLHLHKDGAFVEGPYGIAADRCRARTIRYEK
jgi:hypothetical protein